MPEERVKQCITAKDSAVLNFRLVRRGKAKAFDEFKVTSLDGNRTRDEELLKPTHMAILCVRVRLRRAGVVTFLRMSGNPNL